jgi:LPXTG-site transpeptidase (sortase) family protein
LSGICGYEFFAKSMKSKIFLKQALLIAAIIVLLGLFFFISFFSSSRIENYNIDLNQEKHLYVGLPVRLKIPSIGVDALIEHVGLKDGAMDVPSGPAETAWFNLGPRPGENGSAVIAGHYGWKNDIPAIFDNLHKLSRGDKLYIEYENGMIISFVVRESRSYPFDADASEVFILNDGKPHLNLVTCEGIWDKTKKSYSSRLVVFADAE